ncbi:MAG: HepT-like ribonuclease domain-containing protein [Bryobacteraceae bacterium]
MPSSKPAGRLQDIIDNAEAALNYTQGLDETSLDENRLVYDAVERCLERISEAVTKLGDQAQILLPDQPCRAIRALGNRLRHSYDDIGRDHVWEIVRDDLRPLILSCKKALNEQPHG